MGERRNWEDNLYFKLEQEEKVLLEIKQFDGTNKNFMGNVRVSWKHVRVSTKNIIQTCEI